jgi:hypothetical protein
LSNQQRVTLPTAFQVESRNFSHRNKNRSIGVDPEGFVKLCAVIKCFKVTGEDEKTQTQTQTEWLLPEHMFIDFQRLARSDARMNK